MATPAELARLRQFIDELDENGEWSNADLEQVFQDTENTDGSLNFQRAAAQIWQTKAAGLTTLSDVTESGSSRRLSQAFDHAMKMAAMYGSESGDPSAADTASRPQSQRIVRPTRG